MYRFQYNTCDTESNPRWGWFWVWDRVYSPSLLSRVFTPVCQDLMSSHITLLSLSLCHTHSTKLKRYETNWTCTSDCVNTSVYSSFLLQPYSNVTLQYQVPVYIPVMMRAHMKISGQFHTASNKSCRGHVLFPFVLPSINQKGFKFLTSRPGLMQVLVWRLQGQQLHVYHTVLYTPSGAASDPFSITL